MNSTAIIAGSVAANRHRNTEIPEPSDDFVSAIMLIVIVPAILIAIFCRHKETKG